MTEEMKQLLAIVGAGEGYSEEEIQKIIESGDTIFGNLL